PLCRNGVGCGRRVRKLYLSGKYFGCRHCHNLTYRSQQESDSRVYALARGGLDAIDDFSTRSVSQLGITLKALMLMEKRMGRLDVGRNHFSNRNGSGGTSSGPGSDCSGDNAMTTLAKIEANQRNGQLSTGPRTVEGKAIVGRNATKHGIYAAVPVIPGECPATWEAHRSGVVDSLAPVGLLEVNLAERAALLLWRLQRLARYEAETVAADVEVAAVPPLPPP